MGRRLTVLQLLPALDAGGVEQSTVEIAQALVADDHRAIVVSAGGRMLPRLQGTGARHIELPIGHKSPMALRHLPALRRLMADADIVHARSRLPAWLGRLALRTLPASRRPHWMTTVHGLNSPSRYSAVMASGERVVCVSDTVRAHVLRHYPATDPARLRVVPRGIDPLRFPRRSAVDAGTRAQLAQHRPQLGGAGPLLLMPGRGTRLKGHAAAIQLLARLRAGGSDARLWLPGLLQAGRDDYLLELDSMIHGHGLGDAVRLDESIPDMARAYAISDLVLQLSGKPEAFGRTVIEALSVGVPVLGWDHGGVGELLRQLQPGGAVAVLDEDALLQRARGFLAMPPSPPASIPYTLQAMQDATVALYEELAGGG